jgi:tripartite-type tricarboxylate transporter receptor subunit TctC
MRRTKPVVLWLAVALTTLVFGIQVLAAKEASYPRRNLEFVVPFPPGGASDLLARPLAAQLTEQLGKTVVVMNKAGAARLEGGLYVANARPEGYTLGFFGPSAAWPEVFFKEAPYTSQQIALIARVTALPTAVVVSSKSKFQTWQEFVKHAKANPGIRYGHTGTGATPHLLLASLGEMEGINLVQVPLKGDAGVSAAIVGGHVEIAAGMLSGQLAQVNAGNARVLMIHSPSRVAMLPGAPTIDELGLRIDLPYSDMAVCGPKKIPDEVTRRLEEAIAKVVAQPAFKAATDKMGVPIAYLGTAAYIQDAERQKKILSALMQKLGAIQ